MTVCLAEIRFFFVLTLNNYTFELVFFWSVFVKKMIQSVMITTIACGQFFSLFLSQLCF